MKNGTVLKYNEPAEAKKTKGWRIYVFKDGKEIDVLNLDGQSSYLIGKDRMVLEEFLGWSDCRLLIFLWIIVHVLNNTLSYNFVKYPQKTSLATSPKLPGIITSFKI